MKWIAGRRSFPSDVHSGKGTMECGVPAEGVKITATSPQVTILQDLEDAKKDYQLPQYIPEEAWDAFHQLIAMGDDKQLAR